MNQSEELIQVYRYVGYHPLCNQIATDLIYLSYPRVTSMMYGISPNGVVYNSYIKKFCKPFESNKRLALTLMGDNNNLVTVYLERLVAYHFCNPPSYDLLELDNYRVKFIDGNPYNVNYTNLLWEHVRKAPNRLSRGRNNRFVDNGRANVDAKMVHYICQMLQDGLKNTEIMRILGMKINNANHMLIKDIRNGRLWYWISSLYAININSKDHAYTPKETARIENLLLMGKSVKEVFEIMQGTQYIYSEDKTSPEYRAIESVKKKVIRERGI